MLETNVIQQVLPKPSGKAISNRKLAQIKPFNMIVDKPQDLKDTEKKSMQESDKKIWL